MDQTLATRLAEQIERYIENNRDYIISDLQRILQFQTISGGKTPAERQTWRDEFHAGFLWLRSLAEASRLKYKNIEDTVCYLEQPADGPTLGVLLHLDVVPPGEGWTHPPFGGEIADGVIYGRGCQDDKGPIIQCLHALRAIKSLGLPFRRCVRLIIGSEEETGVWADVKRYLEVESAPEFSIVPDGAFPVVNGEKGMLDIRIGKKIEGEESGPLRLVQVSSGVRSNVVPPLAEIKLRADSPDNMHELSDVLQQFLQSNPKAKAELSSEGHEATIRFQGKNAHGSMPQEGQNAARDSLNFLATLPLQGPRAEFARLLSSLVAENDGHSMNIANRHDFIGGTTQSLGILRIEDSFGEAVINIRHTPPQNTALVLERVTLAIQTLSDSADLPEISFAGKRHEPLFVDPERYPEYFMAMETAYSIATGRPARRLAMGGTTFAKAFPNAMCFGPTDAADEQELAHQADERVSIENHLRNVRIYALALALLALDVSGA